MEACQLTTHRVPTENVQKTNRISFLFLDFLSAVLVLREAYCGSVNA